MNIRTILALTLLSVTLVIAPAVSHADIFPGPYVSGSFGFSPTTCPDPSITNASSLNCATGVLHQQSYSFNYSGTDSDGNTKTLNASVQAGAMHLYEQVTRTSTAGSSTNNGVLEYGDSLTVTSNSLAAGTPVDFQFTANLRYSISGPQDLDPNVNLFVTNGLYFEGSPFFPDSTYFGSGIGYEPPVCATGMAQTSGTLTCSFTQSLLVGQTTWFVQRLEGRDGIASAGTETVDAGDTAWLTIQSLDPNAGFTTGSGYSYSGDPDAPATVPEPSSMLMLASGLAVCAQAIRRKLVR